ncbi:hypothetical protein VMCG_00618 [Cytospora schulzeri]|uniref:Mei2-like C-terminal RNA recognition motif domain-containing protein n=1 Tax=Cytospora schulzeri TaxID=448051 RepID=A0A423X971_9PEZI|nr:hypothetical protein VMCG_00618 [Valsa malicola]
MVQQREAFHPSSPPSEGGADSYNHEGTPDTHLTTFSPLGDSSESSGLLSALSLSGGKTNARPIRFQVPTSINQLSSPKSFSSGGQDKDPFVSTTPEKSQTKLSATASAFRPLAASVASTPIVAYGSSSATPKPLASTFTAETRCPKTGLMLASGLSHSLELTRSLRISSSSGPLTIDAAEEYLKKIENYSQPFREHPQPLVAHNSKGVYIRATNIRDAARILDSSEDNTEGWEVDCVSAEEINEACGVDLATDHEGQHTILVVPSTVVSEFQIEANILAHFRHYDIFALERQPALTNGVLRWALEFDVADLTWTIGFMKQGWFQVGGFFWVYMMPYVPGNENAQGTGDFNYFPSPMIPSTGVPDITTGLETLSMVGLQQSMPSMQTIGTPLMPSSLPFGSSGHGPQWHMVPWGFPHHTPQVNTLPYQGTMPRGPSTPAPSNSSFTTMSPMSPNMSLMTPFSSRQSSGSVVSAHHGYSNPRSGPGFYRSDGRRQNATRISRGYFSPPGPHHNHVDIQKIKEGTDIMLRNIPNKVDQQMLKGIIDESSWGKYDFMYLRIDFANDCNVGYAFINFVDPLDIIDFANARGNQRWNCFKSDKVAEISYATIQGKDCLVQKFRNSSVMLEAPHYRPKLYYTVNGPAPEMAGHEELFPEPDNQSKMKRSCENAEHAFSLPTLASTFEMSNVAADLSTIVAPGSQHSKSAANSTCTPKSLSTD